LKGEYLLKLILKKIHYLNYFKMVHKLWAKKRQLLVIHIPKVKRRLM
jgi:hypothetical protein